jgi:group I intron endonuclease
MGLNRGEFSHLKITGIYKITAPDGKIYVGQAKCIKIRHEKYRAGKTSELPRLNESLLKYGFENHVFEVIQKCDVLDLNHWERHYQDMYDVCGPSGLNCKLTRTQDKPFYLIPESRENLSRARVGFVFTEEAKAKMRKPKSKVYGPIMKRKSRNPNSYPFTGKNHSDEAKDKISKARKGKPSSKIIKCLQTNITYKSIRECEKLTGVGRKSIAKVLSGQTNDVNGLQFIYNQ